MVYHLAITLVSCRQLLRFVRHSSRGEALQQAPLLSTLRSGNDCQTKHEMNCFQHINSGKEHREGSRCTQITRSKSESWKEGSMFPARIFARPNVAQSRSGVVSASTFPARAFSDLLLMIMNVLSMLRTASILLRLLQASSVSFDVPEKSSAATSTGSPHLNRVLRSCISETMDGHHELVSHHCRRPGGQTAKVAKVRAGVATDTASSDNLDPCMPADFTADTCLPRSLKVLT